PTIENTAWKTRKPVSERARPRMKPPSTSGAPKAIAIARRRSIGRDTRFSRERIGTTLFSIYYKAMIEVSELSKSYRDVRAVDALSFSVSPGEVLGLVGPNGAGKTTTLRSLCGIINPDHGTIRIDGHDLRLQGPAAKARLAFVPD